MGFVFLMFRFLLGGYFAWHGAQHLNAHGREHLVAYARTRSVPLPLLAVPLSGLLLSLGGVSLAMGVLPAAGVSLLVGVLVSAAFGMHRYWRDSDADERVAERRRFWRNVTLAAAVLALLLVPQPWPLSFR